ncbi:MAG: GAF domain-containing protein [Armatimonadetes bacterium]|nr:GAF domain-containing protein [Armatimonadota bacterium]
MDEPESPRSDRTSARSQDRSVEFQKRTAQISVAAGAGMPLSDVLRMVRDALVTVGEFDRAGVLLYDRHRDVLLDQWGTDTSGDVCDGQGAVRAVPSDPRSPTFAVVRGGKDLAVADDATFVSPSPSTGEGLGGGVPAAGSPAEPGLPSAAASPSDPSGSGPTGGAVAAMRLGDDLVGVLWADNLLTSTPLTRGDLDLLRSAAQGIAGTVLTARVSSERAHHVDIAARLTKLGEVIASEVELDDVLRLVRDAVTSAGRLDRAAVFLKDVGGVRFIGTWGTTRDGELDDIHGAELRLPDDPDDPMNRVVRGEAAYSLVHDYSTRSGLTPDDPMFGVHSHTVLPMRAGDEVVGLVVGDNLLSNAPLTDEDIAVLLPFAEQAALAVRNSRLQSQLRSRIAQLQHLGRIASAITANTELNDMMRLVRDGIVESKLFDRAGVFLYDAPTNTLRGTWGTDRDGRSEDISYNIQEVDTARGMPSDRVISGEVYYSLLNNRQDLGPERTPPWMAGVNWHAVVPMRAGDVIVGVISVDNAITDRPITRSEVELLLPFAEQAAAAVRQAKLSEELRARIAHLEDLGNIAAAIAAETDLPEMLRMVRDAIVSSGMFDRAGVWLYDSETDTITGSWGTDRSGAIEDLSDQVTRLDRESPNPLHRVLSGAVEYSLIENRSALGPAHTPEHMRGVQAHAVVPMRAGDVILGAIGVDNLLTGRPITHEDVRVLLPFAEQSAVAVQKARLIVQIEMANRELEARVEQRAAQLHRVSEEMAAFMYTLSHDLKAPVRAVLGFTCAVLEQYGEALPADARRDLERVRDAARRMGTLMEALLALARLGQSAIVRSRTSPDALVRDAIRDLRAHFPHAATIAIGDLPPCDADPDLLRLVFHSLIKNALEATREATIATISVGFEDGAFFVADNGVGFDQQYAHTLFDVFRRYRPADEWEGAGFGLAFVRRVVEMHGGRIWAEGAPGKGATFRFTIGGGTEAESARPLSVIS